MNSEFDSPPPHYQIMLNDETTRLTVIRVAWHETSRYPAHKVVCGEDGDPIRFDSEADAIKYLNANFRPECIHQDDISADNPAFRIESMRHSGSVSP